MRLSPSIVSHHVILDRLRVHCQALSRSQSQTATMFAAAGTLERKLTEFVSTEPVDWKFYVQVFTWSVCLFESYLLYGRTCLNHPVPLANVAKFPTVSVILEDETSCGSKRTL